MNSFEWVAAVLGVINVVLLIRRSIWNYPFGIAMVVLYFFVFLDAKLYSDAVLQVFFLFVQFYGWRTWTSALAEEGEIVVGVLPLHSRLTWIGATLAAAVVWGFGMATVTDAAAPIPDAFVAGVSVSAQILLARRRLESWVLWIAVDVVAIALFASRGLWWTTGLYVLFLGLAVSGLIAWRRVVAPRRQPTAVAR